jgi:TRAP-type transport system periplasmic protein
MTRTPLITTLFAAALLAGCGSESSDRAGGTKPVEAKVLTMANVNGELGELEAFDAAVGRISGGSLRIKWLNEYGSDREGIAEVNLIRDVSAGKADLGWAGTRVFDELGLPDFNPLHAPMLIDSYGLEETVLADGLADPMLESLGDLELQGVGVLPGPLRRPLGKNPLRDPDEWAGDRIGSSGGEQIAAALRALGATRVLESPHGTTDGLDGFESHVAAVGDDHYHFPYLTGNVVLWPRPLVLFAGPDVSSDDLAVLREAARAAISETIAVLRAREREGLSEICPAKLRVVTASAGQVDGLRAAFRPVYDELGRDPAASRAVARIQELARARDSSLDAVRCPTAAKASAGSIRPGTYRTVVTRADARAHGFSWAQVVEGDPDPRALKAKTREWQIEFTEQGTFLVRDVWQDGTWDIGWEGGYSVYRDRITVRGNDEGSKLTARVEVDGDRLRFTDVRPGPNTHEALTWGSRPFVKID